MSVGIRPGKILCERLCPHILGARTPERTQGHRLQVDDVFMRSCNGVKRGIRMEPSEQAVLPQPEVLGNLGPGHGVSPD